MEKNDDAMMISNHKKTESALKNVLQLAIAVSLDAVSLIVLIADSAVKRLDPLSAASKHIHHKQD